MKKARLLITTLMLATMHACTMSAQELTLVKNSSSDYKIVVPADATKQENRAAGILQAYIKQASGTQLPIVTEQRNMTGPAIYLGNTGRAEEIGKVKHEGYVVRQQGKDLVIKGGSGRGLMYGVYSFIEEKLHADKLTEEPAIVPQQKIMTVPGPLNYERHQQFIYREVYYPAPLNPEYLEWHKLHQFEELWGLWGHTYDKLVPPKIYFKAHPEYYALVKGKRQATQLCLSNEEVYRIVTAELKKRLADNPDAIYWSIGPNDDIGYCECERCKAVDNEQGGPTGSLIKFVNRVAAQFPDTRFTTLAYGFTHRAPKTLKPAQNVYIFLSTIDAFRDKPLAEEGSAATFRNDLRNWKALTPNLFVWDYITQFTNYLAPFPNFHTPQPNMQYLKENGVIGVFAQGSGNTYSEWAELRSYITAKLLENDKADMKRLTADFLKKYYGAAAPHLQQYLDLLHEKMLGSKRKLDIYGNPVNQWNSYLTPELLDEYSTLMDKAEAAVEGNSKLEERVMRARLPLEYTVLQQARFFGLEKHGVFVKNDAGEWAVKPGLPAKVERFVANCKKAKVLELAEGGLTPDEYLAEWQAIFKAGVTPNKATGAQVSLLHPFAEEYPAKGNRTLVDGTPGYRDFSYNWLCFYGVPMVATVDMGTVKSVSKIQARFLDDARHWIFLPSSITFEISEDGVHYRSVGKTTLPAPEEHYTLATREFPAMELGTAKARYIRVTAQNLPTLPEWRYREFKKPMIACDEILVQ